MKMTRKEMIEAGIEPPPLRRRKVAPGDPRKFVIDPKSRRRKPDGNAGRDKVFDALCAAHGLPLPVHEYRFHPERLWRLDYVWEGWLALEVQGGLFSAGRHVRGAALLDEHEKLNEAVIAGFAVLFCCPADVESGAIFATVRRALAAREEMP